MYEAVSLWPFTAVAEVRARTSLCGIYGAQNGLFSRVHRLPVVIVLPQVLLLLTEAQQKRFCFEYGGVSRSESA